MLPEVSNRMATWTRGPCAPLGSLGRSLVPAREVLANNTNEKSRDRMDSDLTFEFLMISLGRSSR